MATTVPIHDLRSTTGWSGKRRRSGWSEIDDAPPLTYFMTYERQTVLTHAYTGTYYSLMAFDLAQAVTLSSGSLTYSQIVVAWNMSWPDYFPKTQLWLDGVKQADSVSQSYSGSVYRTVFEVTPGRSFTTLRIQWEDDGLPLDTWGDFKRSNMTRAFLHGLYAQAPNVTPSTLFPVAGKGVETQTARTGTVIAPPSPQTKVGTRATETDTARAGTVTVLAAGEVIVLGAQATETDVASPGDGTSGTGGSTDGSGSRITLVHVGTRATETSTVYSGTVRDDLRIIGTQALETSEARSGSTPSQLSVTGHTTYVTITTPDGMVDASPPAYLQILDPAIDRAPAALTISMAGLAPVAVVTFTIDGLPNGTAVSDANGEIDGLSLDIDQRYLAGTHTLTATSGDDVATATFTLARNPSNFPVNQTVDADPVHIADAVGSNGVNRWVLQDLMPGGLGSWVMPINPSSMSSPHVRKSIADQQTTAVVGRSHLFEGMAPMDWQVDGFCPDRDFYKKLVAYANLPRRFYVVDHRSRAWTVSIAELDMRPRKRVMNESGKPQDWLHDYTIKFVLYSQTPKTPVTP